MDSELAPRVTHELHDIVINGAVHHYLLRTIPVCLWIAEINTYYDRFRTMHRDAFRILNHVIKSDPPYVYAVERASHKRELRFYKSLEAARAHLRRLHTYRSDL